MYWQGDFVNARAPYEEALAIYRRIDDKPGTANGLYDLSFVLAIVGDADGARRLQEESLALFTALGDRLGITRVRESMAGLALMTGNLAESRVIAASVIQDYRDTGLTYKLADSLMFYAALLMKIEDLPTARRALVEGIVLARSIGDDSSRPPSLQLAALLADAGGHSLAAARMCGTFAAYRESHDAFLTPINTLGVSDPEAQARSHLDQLVFEEAFGEGRKATIEEALDAFFGEALTAFPQAGT
jgi:tetratricopeptide (TPR) repeat protein